MPWEMERSMIEVTSINRPDERWSLTDSAGHVHQWEWPSGERRYSPMQPASLPTCEWVKDEPYYTEEGDEIQQGHYECKECREPVRPGYRADDCEQWIPGLMRRRWVDE